MQSIADQLFEYESKLLDPLLRRTPEKLAALIADDFVEFASSGRTYDKQKVLYHLGRQLPAQLTIEAFRVVELAAGVALVTYRARAESAEGKGERYSLRSSLWVQRGENWQMLFHQGTPISKNAQLNRSPFPFTKKTAGV